MLKKLFICILTTTSTLCLAAPAIKINNLEQKSSVQLSGPWEFYWENFLSQPSESLPQKPILMKKLGWWQQFYNKETQQTFPAIGYGTYRALVKTERLEKGDYILAFHNTYSAARVIFKDLDTLKTWTTQVGKIDRTKTIPSKKSPRIYFELDETRAYNFEILIEASNHQMAQGGVWIAPTLAKRQKISTLLELTFLANVLTIGVSLSVAFYSLSLFSKSHKYTESTYLGIFCIGILARTFATDERLPDFFPESFFYLFRNLEYLSAPFIFHSALEFVRNAFFPKSYGPIITSHKWISLGFVALTLFTPTYIFTSLREFFFSYSLLSSVIILGFILLAVIYEYTGSRILLLGLVLGTLGSFHDILLVSLLRVNEFFIAPFTTIAFMLLQVLIVTNKISYTEAKLEAYTNELIEQDKSITGFYQRISDRIKLVTKEHIAENKGKIDRKLSLLLELIDTQLNILDRFNQSLNSTLKARGQTTSLNNLIQNLHTLLKISLPSNTITVTQDLELGGDSFVTDEALFTSIVSKLILQLVESSTDEKIIALHFKRHNHHLSLECSLNVNDMDAACANLDLLGNKRIRKQSSLDREVTTLVSFIEELDVSLQNEIIDSNTLKIILDFREINSYQREEQVEIETYEAPINLFSGKKPKCLIIDDDIHTCRVLTKYLEECGVEANHIIDGSDAFESILVNLPDFIILDIMLPKTSGEAILQDIINDEETTDIPVIIISSKQSEKEKFLRLGADHFISKPVLKDELASQVDRILERKELIKQVEQLKNHLNFEKGKRQATEAQLEIINKQSSEFEAYLLLGELAEEIRKDLSSSIENINIAHNISGLTLQALIENLDQDHHPFEDKIKKNHLNNIYNSQKQLEDTIKNLKKIEIAFASQVHNPKDKREFMIQDIVKEASVLLRQKTRSIDFNTEIKCKSVVIGFPHQISQVISHYLFKACEDLNNNQKNSLKKAKLDLEVFEKDDGLQNFVSICIVDYSSQDLNFNESNQRTESYTDSLCKRIIQAHDGQVDVLVELNKKTISILLPRVANKLQSKAI